MSVAGVSRRTKLGGPSAVAPGAPVIGTTTAGNNQVVGNWSAPATDGGSPITSYTMEVLRVSDNAVVSSGTTGGLTGTLPAAGNGVAVYVRVRATNAIGTGPNSANSNTVTPATVPGAPVIGTATASDSTVTGNWTAPASNGGSAITSYTMEVRRNGVVESSVVTSALTGSVNVDNGLSYTVRVKATNAIGAGPYSADSNAVTPNPAATVPSQVATPGVTAGNGSVNITWSTPSNGGSAITNYRISTYRTSDNALLAYDNPGVVNAFTKPALTNGTSYYFKVAAINAIGTGADSPSSANVTPTAPAATVPGAVGNPSSDGNTIYWTTPSNGGSPILGYDVYGEGPNNGTQGGGGAGAGATSVAPNFPPGDDYDTYIAAYNAIGYGPYTYCGVVSR